MELTIKKFQMNFLVYLKKVNDYQFSSANIWNESEYVKPEVLKEKYGYKIFTLYRKDKLKWYISTVKSLQIMM